MAGYFEEDELKDNKFTHYGISQMIPAEKLGNILYGEEIVKRKKEQLDKDMMAKKPKPASGKPIKTDSPKEDM